MRTLQTENGRTIWYDVKSWAYDKWRELEEKNIFMPEEERIFNFIGQTTVRQSLTILSTCSLAAGAELHCASGLGVKTLTVFGGPD